jgi:xylulokinase
VILAVDVGSSAVKAGLFSDSGALAKTARAELRASTRRDPRGAPLAHEVDPSAWIEAIASIAPALLGEARHVEWVVVSGNGPTLLPADAEGRPLHDALTWMDRRASEEAEDASAAAGAFIDPSFALPKALWFKRQRPAIYERTAAFLSCPEYVVRVLTGESTTIVPAGYERHYGDASLRADLGLDPSKFPPLARPGATIGRVVAAGEAATGIPAGARVVAAGPDFLAALVGTATVAPGRACDRAGTSEGVNLCASRATDDARLLSVPHIVPPYTNLSAYVSTSGAAVDWWRAAAGCRDVDYDAFFAEAGRAAAGASRVVFLPYLAGERAPIWDAAARGAFIGLSLGHGRAEMSRAVIESIAFAMRDIIEVMEEVGAPVAELRATGKPTQSELWNRIKADITGRPISLPECGEPELMGDACFGLAAAGRYASLAEAAEDLVRMRATFEPDRSAKGLYDELFGVYREAYAALKPLFGRFSADDGARQ